MTDNTDPNNTVQFTLAEGSSQLYFADVNNHSSGATLAYLLPPNTPNPPATLTLSDSWAKYQGFYIFFKPNTPIVDLNNFVNLASNTLFSPTMVYTQGFAWVDDPNASSLNLIYLVIGGTPGTPSDPGNAFIGSQQTFQYRNLGLYVSQNCPVSDPANDQFSIANEKENPIFLTSTLKPNLGVIGASAYLPLTGEGTGCLQFQVTLQEADIDQLDVGLRYFVDQANTPNLDSQRYPIFNLTATGSPLDMMGSLDPIASTTINNSPTRIFVPDPERNFFSFTGQAGSTTPIASIPIVSYFSSHIGQTVTLLAANTAKLVFAVNPSTNQPNINDPYYLIPLGDFALGIKGAGIGSQSDGLISSRLLCGLTGTEYFGFTDSENNVLSFALGQPAYAPSFKFTQGILLTPGSVSGQPPTGGTFMLSYAGQTTTPLAYDAAASDVQSALAALSNIGTGNIFCAGGPLPASPLTVQFGGAITQPSLLSGDGSALTGAAGDVFSVQQSENPAALALINILNPQWVGIAPGSQSGQPPTGGTFTLDYAGQTTTPLAYDAAPNDIQSALAALSLIGASNVTCANGPLPTSPVAAQFGGTITQPSLLSGDGSALTGAAGDTFSITVSPAILNATSWVSVKPGGAGTDAGSYYAQPPSAPLFASYSQQVSFASQTPQAQPAGGTFTLGYAGQTTAALAYNAAASDVQNALAALSGIGAGNVACMGGPLPATPIVVQFSASLPPPQALTGDGSKLTDSQNDLFSVAIDPAFLSYKEIGLASVSVNASSNPAPLVPYTGINSTPAIDLESFESHVLNLVRKSVVTNNGEQVKAVAQARLAAKRERQLKGMAADTTTTTAQSTTTPQGFLVDLDTGNGAGATWSTMKLAQNAQGAPATHALMGDSLEDFFIENISAAAQDALQRNQIFLVVTSLNNLFSFSANGMLSFAGWSFNVAPENASSISDPKDFANCPTAMIFKFYNNVSLLDLLGQTKNWTLASQFNSDTGKVQEYLQAYVKTAVDDVKKNGQNSKYYDFNQRITDPNWNGIMSLNVRIPPSALPSALQGLKSGLGPLSNLRAYFVGIEINDVQNMQISTSSLSAMIDYENPNKAPETPPTGYSFYVPTLQIGFANSEITYFNCIVKVGLGSFFGDEAKTDSTGNAGDGKTPVITINGTYQNHDGESLYSFVSEGEFKFNFPASKFLASLTLTKIQFNTETIENSGIEVTSSFSFWGNIEFASVGGGSSALDPFSFGKLSFAGLSLGMSYTQESVAFSNGSKSNQPPTGGTFTLSFGGQTTSPLAYNAAASDVQNALTALSSVGTNNITCSGGPLPGLTVGIEFDASIQNPGALTGDGSGLTGGAGDTFSINVASTSTSFSFNPGDLRFDLGSSVYRPGSLISRLPLKLKSFMYSECADMTVDSLGYYSLGTLGFGLPEATNLQFALVFELDLGSMGALVSSLSAFKMNFVVGWIPDITLNKDYCGEDMHYDAGMIIGVQLPDIHGKLQIGVEGVLQLIIQNFILQYPKGDDKNEWLALVLNNCTLDILGTKIPPAPFQFSFYIFSPSNGGTISPGQIAWAVTVDGTGGDDGGDSGGEGGGEQDEKLALLAHAPAGENGDGDGGNGDSKGGSILSLKYLGLGQRVGPAESSSITNFDDALAWMKGDFADAVNAAEFDKVYQPDQSWLVVAQLSLLSDVVTLGGVFYDPQMYSLQVQIPSLFTFEITYTKISDTIGMYYINVGPPAALRQMQFGAFSVSFPNIAVSIYTNGDFLVDVGFPYNMDFSKSFQIQSLPFTGAGGFYFGKLSAATTDVFPQPSYHTILKFGIGVQIGLGKDFNQGILSAGLSITFYGILEGALGYGPANLPASGINLLKPDALSIQGQFGIIGKIYGSIDFGIIQATVTVEIIAGVGIQMLIPGQNYLELWVQASVSLSVSIRINLLFFHVTISFSFSATFRFDWQIPYGSSSSSSKATLFQFGALKTLRAENIKPLRWLPVYQHAALAQVAGGASAPPALNIYFMPELTMLYPGPGQPGTPYCVASLIIECPEPDGMTGSGSGLTRDAGDVFSVTAASSPQGQQLAINAVTVTTQPSPTGGTFTLSYGGQTTSALAYNAAASDVQNALAALSSIGAGNVTCTGGPLPSSPISVSFSNITNPTALAGNGSQLSDAQGDSFSISVSSNLQITIVPSFIAPTGGTFTLTYGGQTTPALPYNATAAQIATALTGLTTIGQGIVSTSGGPLPNIPVEVDFNFPFSMLIAAFSQWLAGNALSNETFQSTQVAISTGSVTGKLPESGTFTLGFEGETTAPIPYTATADDVSSALENISVIGSGNVLCTGGPLPQIPVEVDFINDVSPGTPTYDASSLQSYTTDIFSIPVAASQQAQQLSISAGSKSGNAPTGGTFTLSYGGQTTTPLAYNAAASDVQNALAALSSIGAGNVTCTGGPLPSSPVSITFGSSISQPTALSGSGANLTGAAGDSFTINVSPAQYAVSIAPGSVTQGVPTEGTFTLTYNGQQTGPLMFDAAAADVAKALAALSNTGPNFVKCSGGPLPGAPVTVLLTGAITQAVTLTGDGSGLLRNSGDVFSINFSQMVASVFNYQTQQISIQGQPTSGTFTLGYGGQTTTGLAYNAAASDVQSALAALSNIGTGNVICSGGPLPQSPVVVQFTGSITPATATALDASGSGLQIQTDPMVTRDQLKLLDYVLRLTPTLARAMVGAANEESAPLDYAALVDFLTNNFTVTVEQAPNPATESNVDSATPYSVTFFPMIPDLELQTQNRMNNSQQPDNYDVKFWQQTPCDTDYQDYLSSYFAQMFINVTRDSNNGNLMAEAEDTPPQVSMATIVFQDYFDLIAKQMVDTMYQQVTNSGGEFGMPLGDLLTYITSLNQTTSLAGMLSKVFRGGLRIPPPPEKTLKLTISAGSKSGNAPTGGTFTLSYGGQTTTPLAYNAAASDVQNALAALSSIGAGNVSCTGGPLPSSPVSITFGSSISQPTPMTGDGSQLVGASGDQFIVQFLDGLFNLVGQQFVTENVSTGSNQPYTLQLAGNPSAPWVSLVNNAAVVIPPTVLSEISSVTITPTFPNGIQKLPFINCTAMTFPFQTFIPWVAANGSPWNTSGATQTQSLTLATFPQALLNAQQNLIFEVAFTTGTASGNAPAGGTFTLGYGGQTTAGIPWNATASQIEAALETLSSVGADNVSCTGGPLPAMPVSVHFEGVMTDPTALTGLGTNLTGGTGDSFYVRVDSANTYLPSVAVDLKVTDNSKPISTDDPSLPTADYYWATSIQLNVRQVPTPANGTGGTSSSSFLANIYQLTGADATNRRYLEQVLDYINTGGGAQNLEMYLLYQSAAGATGLNSVNLTPQSPSNTFLLRTNMSTEELPPPTFKMMAEDPENVAVDSALQVDASFDETGKFLQIIEDCSITNQAGFYLFYQEPTTGNGLPSALFSGNNPSPLSLLIVNKASTATPYQSDPQATLILPFYNTLVLAPNVQPASDGKLYYAQSALLPNSRIAISAGSVSGELPTGGTFTLGYGGQTTTALAYNAAASDVQSALAALSNIGTGNVTCTGGPLPSATIEVEFTGTITSPTPMTGNGQSLTGASGDIFSIAVEAFQYQLPSWSVAVAPGCVGFLIDRNNPNPLDGSAPTTQNNVEALYNALDYSVDVDSSVANYGFCPSGESLPVTAMPWPTEHPDTVEPPIWRYSQFVPVYKYAKANNDAACQPKNTYLSRYAGINQEVFINFRLRDVFGNVLQMPDGMQSQKFTNLYFDSLVPISQWPGVKTSYDFQNNYEATANTLYINLHFDNSSLPPINQADKLQQILENYQLIQDQIQAEATTFYYETSLDPQGLEHDLQASDAQNIVTFVGGIIGYLTALLNNSTGSVPADVMIACQIQADTASLLPEVFEISVELGIHRNDYIDPTVSLVDNPATQTVSSVIVPGISLVSVNYQQIAISTGSKSGSAPTGGTFTLSYGGQTTTPLAYNAAASDVQNALAALSTIGAGNVACMWGPLPSSPLIVQLTGTTDSSVPLTGDGTNLTGATGDTFGISVSPKLTVFAGYFNQAFAQLMLATMGQGSGTALWAVKERTVNVQITAPFEGTSTNPATDTSVAVNRSVFFSPEPLRNSASPDPSSNSLDSGTVNVPVYDLSNANLQPGQPSTVAVSFVDVDMDVYFRQFLTAYDRILSPDISVMARRILQQWDTANQTNYLSDFDQFLQNKQAVAEGYSNTQVSWLIESQAAGQYGNQPIAYDDLAQQMSITLSNAYAIDSIVQYPVNWTTQPPASLGGNLNLFGNVQPVTPTATSNYSLPTATVSFNQPGTEYSFGNNVTAPSMLSFTFGASLQGTAGDSQQTTDAQSSVIMDLQFTITYIQYRPAANDDWVWLQLVPTEGLADILNVHLGPPDTQSQIPVPLRQYPTPPTLMTQTGSPGVTSQLSFTSNSGNPPTGGTFTLSYGGQTTPALAYNAAALDVQNALDALSSIGAGNVSCEGGPLPSSPLTMQFAGTTDSSTPLTGNGAYLTGGAGDQFTVQVGANLNTASLWVFGYSYQMQEVAQDDIHTAVTFNSGASQSPRPMWKAAVTDNYTLFEALCMFFYAYPGLQTTLLALSSAKPASATIEQVNAIRCFMQLAGWVANNTDWTPPPGAEEFLQSSSSSYTSSFVITDQVGTTDNKGNPTSRTLTLSPQEDNPKQSPDIQNISLLPLLTPPPTSIAVKFTGGDEQVTYQFASGQETTDSMVQREIQIFNLDVRNTENALASVQIYRNEDLFKDSTDPGNQWATVEGFIYKTPPVAFNAATTPLIDNQTAIDVADLDGQGDKSLPLAQHLTKLLDELFQGALTDQDSGRRLKVGCDYSFVLNAQLSDPVTVPVILMSPQELDIDPAHTGIQFYATNLANAILAWASGKQLPVNESSFVFDITIFAALSGTNLPVLRLRNLALALQYITDLPQ